MSSLATRILYRKIVRSLSRNLSMYLSGGFGMHRLCRAMAGFVMVLSAISASAIDPNRMVSQYLHDSWGTDKGFPSGSVSAIVQTADGYLWVGTDKGLIRFDGLNFRRFEQTDPGAI